MPRSHGSFAPLHRRGLDACPGGHASGRTAGHATSRGSRGCIPWFAPDPGPAVPSQARRESSRRQAAGGTDDTMPEHRTVRRRGQAKKSDSVTDGNPRRRLSDVPGNTATCRKLQFGTACSRSGSPAGRSHHLVPTAILACPSRRRQRKIRIAVRDRAAAAQRTVAVCWKLPKNVGEVQSSPDHAAPDPPLPCTMLVDLLVTSRRTCCRAGSANASGENLDGSACCS